MAETIAQLKTKLADAEARATTAETELETLKNEPKPDTDALEQAHAEAMAAKQKAIDDLTLEMNTLKNQLQDAQMTGLQECAQLQAASPFALVMASLCAGMLTRGALPRDEAERQALINQLTPLALAIIDEADNQD